MKDQKNLFRNSLFLFNNVKAFHVLSPFINVALPNKCLYKKCTGSAYFKNLAYKNALKLQKNVLVYGIHLMVNLMCFEAQPESGSEQHTCHIKLGKENILTLEKKMTLEMHALGSPYQFYV